MIPNTSEEYSKLQTLTLVKTILKFANVVLSKIEIRVNSNSLSTQEDVSSVKKCISDILGDSNTLEAVAQNEDYETLVTELELTITDVTPEKLNKMFEEMDEYYDCEPSLIEKILNVFKDK